MNNRAPFAALTFAFTVVGACLGYSINEPLTLILITIIIAGVGGLAAALSGENL
jgi:hypothetical protein